MMAQAGIAALALMAAAPLAAQETRVAGAGSSAPPAEIHALAWLEGQWRGEGIDGAPATESWLAPAGDTMVGTFVQEKAGGGILFTEHMQIMEDGGSLVLKLKHFNPDLTGWEEKDGMVTFRLLSLDHCLARFSGLTIRCDGPDKLVVAVRMKSDAAEPEELLFRFDRAERPSGMIACDGTTLELNACMAGIRERAGARKARYLAAALARNADQPELVALIRKSDDAFEAYRTTACEAVYTGYEGGTIRTVQALGCEIALIDERTRTIWQQWLTYMDTTQPDLPAPGRSR